MTTQHEGPASLQRNRLARQSEGIEPTLEGECRSDGANSAGFALEADLLAYPEDGFDACTVSAEEILETNLTQPSRRPLKLPVVQVQEMKTADSCMNGGRTDRRARIIERVDDACVAAAG